MRHLDYEYRKYPADIVSKYVIFEQIYQAHVEYLSNKVEYFINREELWPIVMAKQRHDDEDNVGLRIIDKVMKNRCARISWVFEFLRRSKIKQNVELLRQSLCLFNADLLIIGDAVRCVCRKPLAQIFEKCSLQ